MSQYPAVIELSGLDGTNGFQISGETAIDNSGISVSSAGDVNGDGFDDVIVGAYHVYSNGSNAGASYVVFGKASGFHANLNLSNLSGSNGFQISGEAAGDFSGFSVSGAGDVNGDGFADVILGAFVADPNGAGSGASYVVFGKASGFTANFNLSTLDGSNGFRINGDAVNDYSGFSVSGAGDVNGDNFDDLIVGGFGADPNGLASGASYVVFGKASGFGSTLGVSSLNGTNGFRINGEAADDQSAISVSSAGDVNGDGFDDLLVGADSADPNGSFSGASYVVFGKASGFSATLELSSLDGNTGFQISGEAGGDYSGHSVSAAGDVNGDGFADLIVGSYGADAPGSSSGASYVVFGKASGFAATLELSALDGTIGFRINGEDTGDKSGFSVSSAGDFNGDGFDDLIVGAPNADPNGNYSGASYVVFGKASGFTATFDLSGLDGNNGFQISGEAIGDHSGRSVSAAGDVNGDGFDDLIVGGSDADPNGSASGASYVIFGGMPGEAVVRTGTAIANTIHGGNFDDTLTGLGGGDHLFGHGGNDDIRGGDGNDAIDGGDGKDTIAGNNGNDKLVGGNGGDTLNGGAGKDTLIGAGGVDHFVYGAASDSTGKIFDIVQKADFTVDIWDVPGTVTGIDATRTQGALSDGATFDTDLSAAINASRLGAHHAVLFKPTSGTLTGKIFMVVDVNGVDGYQAGADLVVQLNTAQHLGSLDVADFV